MHGRVKERTDVEKEKIKRKEREEKLKKYLPCLERIYTKRDNKEYDPELMTLTETLLVGNPDFNTLWNIRKECLLKHLENNEKEEDLKAVGMIFSRDLDLTQTCVRANSKSYGAWHHRCWILENSPEKELLKEVSLCNLYLKEDERNFHCWDHRRFVVEKAEVKPEDELNFCTEKIKKNFSNYSSWHYRSKLLPILYPHETDPRRPISEEMLKSELKLVLDAAFTDPKDSSAWLYQRWLLGYSEPSLDLAAFYLSNEKAIISFTKPVNLQDFKINIPFSNSFVVNTPANWSSTNGLANDHTWTITGKDFVSINSPTPENLSISVKSDSQSFSLNNTKTCSEFYGVCLPKFEYVFEEAVKNQLTDQLDKFNTLLELDPESKWTLLTIALLMRAIDRKVYHEETLKFLAKLQAIDSLRAGYYKDLASKWNIEEAIENWVNCCDIDEPVDLAGLRLTRLYYTQYLSVAKAIKVDEMPEKLKQQLKSLPNCKNLMSNSSSGGQDHE